jgi:hypothetical protein
MVLHNVTVLDSFRARAGAAGAASAVVAAMRGHALRPLLQEAACTALYNLAANNAANKLRCGMVGALDCVVVALRAHPVSEGLAETGCDTLRILCAHAKVCAMASEAGCVEAVLAVLRAHPSSEAVQAAACWALVVLLKGPTVLQDKARRAGAAEELESVLARTNVRLIVNRAKDAQARLVGSRNCCIPMRRANWDVEMGTSGDG